MPHVAEKPIPRLRPVAEISTYSEADALTIADALSIVTANYQRLRAEVDRLKGALQREAYHMDQRDPHRRKV